MQEVIKFPECLGCPKVIEQEWESTGALIRVCKTYVSPKGWWRRGGCPVKPREVVQKKKKFVNPLKASKRGNRG